MGWLKLTPDSRSDLLRVKKTSLLLVPSGIEIGLCGAQIDLPQCAAQQSLSGRTNPGRADEARTASRPSLGRYATGLLRPVKLLLLTPETFGGHHHSTSHVRIRCLSIDSVSVRAGGANGAGGPICAASRRKLRLVEGLRGLGMGCARSPIQRQMSERRGPQTHEKARERQCRP